MTVGQRVEVSMREVDKILAGLALLSPHAFTGRIETLGPNPAMQDAPYGLAIDCKPMGPDKEYTLKALGWTWDCEVSQAAGEAGCVCWKFLYEEDE